MSIYFCYMYLLLVVAAWIGLSTTRRLGGRPFRLLAWLPAVTIPVELLGLWTGIRYHRNHWLYNCWMPLECCWVLLVFYLGVRHRLAKRAIGWLLVLMPVGILTMYYVNFMFLTINLYAMLFVLFWQLIGGCIVLADCLLGHEDVAIFRHPLSWMSVGVILYACMFILMYASWVFMPKVNMVFFVTIVIVANTLFYGGMTLTFLVLRRKRESSVPG
jgi:hypothetical protein